VRARRQVQTKRAEEGIALLISIFILLLISVVAIALIVSSGTESSLAGNYRSATGVYYAALGGMEEARGRLLTNNANSFKTTAPANFQLSPLPIGYANYVLNPGPTDNQATMLTTYPDGEYASEFGAGPTNTSTTLSIWASNPLKTSLNFPGPLYKWVRINAVSEKSLKIDFDSNPNSTTPLYYDGAHFSNSASAGPQVLEITSLAVLPNGSQKLLQYVIAPGPVPLPPFLATLSLSGSPGNQLAFHAPGSNSSYSIKGNDYDCSGNSTSQKYPAIGLLTNSNSDIVHVKNGIPSAYWPNYTGVNNPGPYVPDVEDISSSFPLNLQSPGNLDGLAQSIIQNSDAFVVTPTPPNTPPYLGTADASDLHAATTAAGMASSNPVTVVINGNLDVSDWGSHGYGQGYGLLLVTGTFTYDPDTTWNGIILVIGQGITNNTQNGGSGQLNGAVFVAETRGPGPSFSLLSSLGGGNVQFGNSMGGDGMQYSACWIQKAQPKGKYKILSFREISQ
jgi:hypothetical protein